MRVYLLRHGTAEPRPADGGDSPDRELIEKGRDQSRRLGEVLARIDLDFDRVLCSPYLRAKQTAEEVLTTMKSAAEVELVESLTPFASVRGAISAIFTGAKHAPRNVLAVGHEPLLSALASALIGGDFASIDLRKGGMVELDVISADPPRAELIGLLRPRYLRGFSP